MLSFSVNQYGYTSSGISAKKLMSDVSKMDEIDIFGLNCGVGPAHMLQVLEKLSLPEDKYILALPNAAYPTLSRSQLNYGNNAQYFADKMFDLYHLGIDIIGGCCGTTPQFIEEILKRIDTNKKIERLSKRESNQTKLKSNQHGFIYDESGLFKNRKVIAVELAPPFDADDEKLLEAAHILKHANVDVLTFPDSPSGRTRVDSILMAENVKRETGLESCLIFVVEIKMQLL